MDQPTLIEESIYPQPDFDSMSIATSTTSSSYHAPPLLVVTDLDGTLLDHYTYRFEEAREALARLRQLEIPLVPNTSKTRAELGPLRQELGIDDPFIVENGSAIFLPRESFPLPPDGIVFNKDYYLVELGTSYQAILDCLARLKKQYRFCGFQDLSDDRLQQLTGLDQDRLALAKQRQYSEPLIWQDSDLALKDFMEKLAEANLRTLQGGRFLHVLGSTDKGRALNSLRSVYEQGFGQRFTVVALGDSDNDIDMLEASDWPVIIRSPNHAPLQLRSGKPATISEHTGPRGWNECVLELVEKFLATTED